MKKRMLVPAIALLFLAALPLSASATITNKENSETTFVKPNPKVNLFCMAIVKGDTETVKGLIDVGADVNEKSNGMTPLMYAAKYNKADIVKILITNGAKLKAKDDRGFTALKHAQLSGAKDAEVLIAEALGK